MTPDQVRLRQADSCEELTIELWTAVHALARGLPKRTGYVTRIGALLRDARHWLAQVKELQDA